MVTKSLLEELDTNTDHVKDGQPIGKVLSAWLFIALCAFISSYYLDLPAKASNTIYYALFGLPVLFTIVRRRKLFLLNKTALPFFIFLGLATIAEFLSIEGNPILLIKNSIYLIVLYAGIQYISTNTDGFRWLFAITGLLSVGYFFLPLYQWVERYLVTGHSQRIQIYQLNVSRSSLLIAFGMLSLWVLVVEPWLKRKQANALRPIAFFSTVAMVCLVAVVFQSRSTLVVLSLFLVCYGITRSYARQAALIALILAGIAFSTGLYDVFLERGISYRGEIWQDALTRVGLDCSWLTGCGSDGDYRFAGQFLNPHSGYVATLYYYGFPASVALFVLICQVFIKGMREKSPYLLLSTVGWGGAIASSGGFIHAPEPQWVYLWIPVFLTLASKPKDGNSLSDKNEDLRT